MTVQTFSFRADSRGLRQILVSEPLCHSACLTQVLPWVTLGGGKALSVLCLSLVCRPSLLFFCRSCCIVECFDLWERAENLPLNFWILQLEMLRNQLPILSRRLPLFFFPPPHHSLMKCPRDNIWHESIGAATKDWTFLPVMPTNTRCILKSG